MLVTLTSSGSTRRGAESTVDVPARLAATPRTVPPPRAALNALLDAFVPQVLGRGDLAAGRQLVTPDARGLRADWLRGVTPFQAYAARGTRFHGWIVNYSYPGDIGFDIFLAAKDPHAVSMAFRGEAKRTSGRWQIAVFYPQATFQPAGKTQTVVADTDFQPHSVGSAATDHSTLSPAWLALPGAVVAAIAIAALAVAGVRWRRSRARARAFARELAQHR